MGLILGGALMGAGAFGQQLQRQWGAEELEKMREDAANARQTALLSAQKSMQQAGFANTKDLEINVRQPFAKSEREAGEKFKTEESKLERDSRENMQIDRLALEEVLGHERNAIESKRVGIAGAQLANDTARLNLEKQVKEIQIKAANFDLKDKERFDTLKTKYLDPNTSDKDRAGIADSMYALLGKDKYTAVVGKDDMGNPQFVGAFDTRSGSMKRPAGAGQTGWDSDTGKVWRNGVEVGTAKTVREARALVAGGEKPESAKKIPKETVTEQQPGEQMHKDILTGEWITSEQFKKKYGRYPEGKSRWSGLIGR